jgi:hypothetical protein
MKEASSLSQVAILLVLLGNGCQVNKTGTETRMDEQMLDISYENAKAEELFFAIVNGTEREEYLSLSIHAARQLPLMHTAMTISGQWIKTPIY